MSSLPPETQLWQWNRPNQTWNTNLPAVPDFVSQATLQNLPEGTALFLRSEETPVQITQTDDPVLKIRYYHQDHLGSSSVISDESGELVEEITNYPFGYLRNTYRPRGLAEAYGFSEKEQDAESDLHYFEARYLLAQNGRFSSVDWAAHAVLREGIVTPQLLNSYAYVSNSPLVYEDPDGNFLNFVVGGIIGVAAEATGQIVGSMMEGKSFSDAVDNIDYRQVVVAGAIGALTGGASAMAGNALKLGAKIAVQASIEITGQVVESIGKQMVVNGSMDIRKVDPLKTISDVSIGLLSAGVSTRVGEIGSGLLRNKITKNAMSNVSDPLSINGAAVVKKTVQSFEGLIRASGDLGQGTTAVLSSAVNAVNTELNQKPSEDKFK